VSDIYCTQTSQQIRGLLCWCQTMSVPQADNLCRRTILCAATCLNRGEACCYGKFMQVAGKAHDLQAHLHHQPIHDMASRCESRCARESAKIRRPDTCAHMRSQPYAFSVSNVLARRAGIIDLQQRQRVPTIKVLLLGCFLCRGLAPWGG